MEGNTGAVVIGGGLATSPACWVCASVRGAKLPPEGVYISKAAVPSTPARTHKNRSPSVAGP